MQFSSDLERQLNGYGLTTANACFVLGTVRRDLYMPAALVRYLKAPSRCHRSPAGRSLWQWAGADRYRSGGRARRNRRQPKDGSVREGGFFVDRSKGLMQMLGGAAVGQATGFRKSISGPSASRSDPWCRARGAESTDRRASWSAPADARHRST